MHKFDILWLKEIIKVPTLYLNYITSPKPEHAQQIFACNRSLAQTLTKTMCLICSFNDIMLVLVIQILENNFWFCQGMEIKCNVLTV